MLVFWGYGISSFENWKGLEGSLPVCFLDLILSSLGLDAEGIIEFRFRNHIRQRMSE